MTDSKDSGTPEDEVRKRIADGAQRALAEAAERRRSRDSNMQPEREIDGRGGLDPVRFGDWEVKGIASDF